MSLFGMLDLSGTAMQAERLRAEVVASNMANAETTRTPEGGPYRRQLVLFRSAVMRAGGSFRQDRTAHMVRVDQVVDDAAPPVRRYEPNHPDADEEGYVSYPQINPIEEMTDLMSAERAYELNAAALQAAKAMIQQALDIVR